MTIHLEKMSFYEFSWNWLKPWTRVNPVCKTWCTSNNGTTETGFNYDVINWDYATLSVYMTLRQRQYQVITFFFLVTWSYSIVSATFPWRHTCNSIENADLTSFCHYDIAKGCLSLSGDNPTWNTSLTCSKCSSTHFQALVHHA